MPPLHPHGFASLPAMLAAAAEAYGDGPALRIARGETSVVTSYASMGERVRNIAAGLVAAGIEPGDRVALFSPNCPEWTIADHAILAAGAITVPIYATSTPAQARHILGHSGAKAAFVGSIREWEHVAGILPQLPELRQVYQLVTDADDSAAARGCGSLSDLEDGKFREHADEVRARSAALTRNDLCGIVYTSGTTGEPKGVMLTHGNLLYVVESVIDAFPIVPGTRNMCFLPLSHAYERAWYGIVLAGGLENAYVTDAKNVGTQMKQIQAQTFVCVPRLYDKIYASALAAAGPAGVKRRIFDWAVDVGRKAAWAREQGRPVPATLRARHLVADRLVLRTIREALGGHKTTMACGGAPLRKEVEEFFFATGETVFQGYGLTETAPMLTCNKPGSLRFGTCGKPVPGTEISIAAEDGQTDGEILVRGPGLMRGYWRDDEATAEVIDADGWFHTGDVGHLDADGYLVITDRIKDLIITAQGKNIAPTPIETALMASPLVELAVVVGDRQRYLTALIQPAFAELEQLAQMHRWPTDRAELVAHPEVIAMYEDLVTEAGRDAAHFERVHRFRLIADELTMESGDLTPTLKVRRRVIGQKYAPLIEQMYSDEQA